MFNASSNAITLGTPLLLYLTYPCRETRLTKYAPDFFYVYPSIWSASTCNNYSCIRLLINEIIYHYLLVLQKDRILYNERMAEFSPQEQDRILGSISTLQGLISDVCANIPYFFNHHNTTSYQMLQDNPPLVSGGIILLWPLYVVGSTEIAPNNVRLWVMGRLKKIVEVMGIKQAAALAYALSIKKDIRVWSNEDNSPYELDVSG